MSSASDLLVHLRPCPIILTFLGREYRIEAMDAVEWIVMIDGPNPDLYEIFPVLAGPEAVAAVEDALWDGTMTTEQVGRVALEAIGVAADRPWWQALRIIGAAKGSWDMVHVNRAVGMSLAGWLDEVWAKIMERIDPKKKASWLHDVEAVPKGWETELDFDAEEQAFLSAMKAVAR